MQCTHPIHKFYTFKDQHILAIWTAVSDKDDIEVFIIEYLIFSTDNQWH